LGYKRGGGEGGREGGKELDSLHADYIIFAAPPQVISSTVIFSPPLPADKSQAMRGCATWMGECGKVCFTYPTRFWTMNEKGPLSGTVFSSTGPCDQIWDNSCASSNTAALCGFVFDDAALDCLCDEDSVRSKILPQFVDIFGDQAAQPLAVYFKSWRDDSLTNAPADAKCGPAVSFGHPLLRQPAHGSRVLWAGTETAAGEQGHMNGAVLAGYRAADELLALLSAHK